MPKVVLKWDNPEVRSIPDIDKRYIDFVLKFIKNTCELKPQFVSFFNNKIMNVEKNGIYVGCSILNVDKFRSGHSRKLSMTWESLSPYNFSDCVIHPGTFSFMLQKGDRPHNIFSVYKDQNSIAIADLFDSLKRFEYDGNKKDHDRLESLIKVMFNSSKKSFKNFELAKISIESILKELEIIKIGTDPEFTIVSKKDKGNFINAYNVVKSQEFKIGCDGHQSILELRPQASASIDEFLNNLDLMVEETSEMIDDDDFDLLTGGGGFQNEPLGGHIHFSNVQPSSEFLSMLDSYIGDPLRTLPGSKRAAGGDQYDKGSQFRPQSYDEGKVLGFEYRTPPCFWVDEKLTKAVYVISMLCAKTFMLHKKQQKQFEYNSTFDIENYKKLIDFEKYKDLIMYFCKFIKEKSPINGYVFENWDIKRKKTTKTLRIPIDKTNDDLLKDIIPDYVDIYKPPFRSLTIYGLSEKSTPLCAINIDSYFINSNVHTGYLHRWMRDYVREVCIIDKNLKKSNIDDFVDNGRLWIGLSIQMRQSLAKMEVNARNKFFKSFLKRLSVFVRDSILNPVQNMLDENDENEMKEFNKIKELIK